MQGRAKAGVLPGVHIYICEVAWQQRVNIESAGTHANLWAARRAAEGTQTWDCVCKAGELHVGVHRVTVCTRGPARK